MTSDRIIRSPYPEVEIPDVSLVEYILGRAEERGDQPALIDAATGKVVSYAELGAAARRIASGLLARGLARGDLFAIWTPNSLEFVLAYYGVLSAGGAVTTISRAATEREASAQVRGSGARWLLVAAEAAQKLPGVLASTNLREVFMAGESAAGTLVASLMEADAEPPATEVSPDDVAVVLYSSGTTGLPKGVVHTHRTLVAALCSQQVAVPLRSDEVELAALPLSHIAGMHVVMNHTLAAGATLVVMPRFDLEGFLGAIERYRVTRAVVAPPVVLALAKDPIVERYDLSSLRVLKSGAAPLDGDLARTCAGRLRCRVNQGYGMTEAVACTFAPDEGPDKPESVGPPAPGVECRIVDWATGADVAPGEAGELLVRSAFLMRGYLGNEAATAATIDPEGWLHTGDIVRIDSDGWLHVTDRLKELIKYKGYQVAPAELEAVLLSHPAVADAAVVGSPDQEAGEVPKAFVVVRETASADELLAFVADRVAPHKRVRRLEFVEAIPKSPSGKILRRLLVDQERASGQLVEAAR
jgi:acyl-CoA synthetase (AMP-forming)/AMP-acid ligase II